MANKAGPKQFTGQKKVKRAVQAARKAMGTVEKMMNTYMTQKALPKVLKKIGGRTASDKAKKNFTTNLKSKN